MNALKTIFFMMSLFFVLLPGCAGKTTQPEVEKYPRKPDVSDERKSGPAMLFYEAAEIDADPNDVIVIPPDNNEEVAP